MKKTIIMIGCALAVLAGCKNSTLEANDTEKAGTDIQADGSGRTGMTFRSVVVVNKELGVAESIITYVTDAQNHVDTLESWAQPLDTSLWVGFGTVKEEDINFDGYPDLQVCQGPTNGFGNETYEGYVWNPQQHQFVCIPSYSEIPSPEVDYEKKRITGFFRLDNELTITEFEWEDSVLVKKSQEVVDLQSYYDDPEEENPLME